MTKHRVDLQAWNRSAHYELFRAFDDPCYGVTVRIDCTEAYRFVKKEGISFFLYSIFQSLAAAQEIPAFKLRIEEDELFLYDAIDAGSTIDRPDGTFGFGRLLYDPDLNVFLRDASAVVQEVRSSTELKRSAAQNIIRYSSLPWIDFTSISHARPTAKPDSVPRISFGKMTENEGKRSMPVSLHVHHALVDGRDLGEYLDLFQEKLNSLK